MIVLIVAFAAGLAVPTSRAEMHHGNPGFTIVSAIMDDAGNCVHDGCPINQQNDMHGTCFASGAATSALSPPAGMIHFAAVQDVLHPSLDRAMAERAIPPDLHPPKQA